MKHLLLLVFSFSFASANAQISLSTSHVQNYFNVPIYELRGVDFTNGLEFGLGYIHRMKEKRIDFHPSLAVQRKNQNIQSFIFINNQQEPFPFGKMTENMATLNFQFRFFPFDLNGKNQITVMRKDNNVLKQGFYLFGQTGLSLIHQQYELMFMASIGGSTLIPVEKSFFSQAIRFGLGAGLELGLSKRLSINFSIAAMAYPNYAKDFLSELWTDCNILCSDTPPENFSNNDFNDIVQRHIGITLIYEFQKHSTQ